MDIKQRDDGSMAIVSGPEGLELLRVGGPKNPYPNATGSSSASAPIGSPNFRTQSRLKMRLFNGTSNITGAMGVFVNNTDGPLLVSETTLNFVSGQALTSTISVGTGTMSGNIELKGSTNNLIDSFAYAGSDATPVANNIDDKGSSGKSRQYLAVGDAIGVSTGRALLTAVVDLYVTVTKA